jgi:iron complex outermembrane receptor protein
MSFLRKILWLAVCLNALNVFPQKGISDSIFTIPEVAIYSNRSESFSIGSTIQRIDSLALLRHRSQSVAELLNVSGINVKSYGLGGLSTVMLRGGGSSHTAVVWNGMSIESPMTGSLNLTMYPVSLFNSVKIQYGGSGTLYGSGAVSGIMHLSSNAYKSPRNSISAHLETGSANSHNGSVSLTLGNARASASVRTFVLSSDNDYEFYNTATFEKKKERITNAGAFQYGTIADGHIQLARNIDWALSGWLQYNDKDIQTLMTDANTNDSNQKDNAINAVSNLKITLGRSTLRLMNGLQWGRTRYVDPGVESSDSRFRVFPNEVEIRHAFSPKHELLAGLNYTHEVAYSDDYIQPSKQRTRVSVFESYRFSLLNGRVQSVLGFREEIVDAETTPVACSLGADIEVIRRLKLKGNISKSYKLPTLNALYWGKSQYAQGNPDLMPESGWTGDIGLEYQNRGQFIRTENSASLFFSDIDNWIVWLPQVVDNQSKWIPRNLDRGKAHGIELKTCNQLSMNRFELTFSGFYTYTVSEMFSGDSYNHNPMIYSPKHKFSGSVSAICSGFSILYEHTYTGKRYTDHSLSLPYNNVGDLSIGYGLKNSILKLNIQLRINNIWNERYQMTASYAMPLRNYSLALTVDINS